MDRLVMTEIVPGVCPDYKTEVTGRCHACKARFIWPRKLGKLKDMQCPSCLVPLHQTTHLFKGDTYRLSSAEEWGLEHAKPSR
jgi:hypothetical protein